MDPFITDGAKGCLLFVSCPAGHDTDSTIKLLNLKGWVNFGAQTGVRLHLVTIFNTLAQVVLSQRSPFVGGRRTSTIADLLTRGLFNRGTLRGSGQATAQLLLSTVTTWCSGKPAVVGRNALCGE